MIRTAMYMGVLLVFGACSSTDRSVPIEPVATVLVEDDGGDPNSPRPSPDGTRLAWSQPVDGQSAIFVGGADGSDPIRLTHGVWDHFPTWSPDGQWIAYQAESPDYDIFVVPSTGGEARQLTSGPSSDFPWSWMPDGSGVVFTRQGAGPMQTIMVPLEGGSEQRLVPAQDGNQYVVVSPDGTQAAVGLLRAGEQTIWLQATAGAAPRQLTSEGFEELSTYPWSPDGRFLAYQSRRTGTFDIWIVDIQSGEQRQITTDVNNDENARWSPDGRSIAFLSDRGGQVDLWIVPVAGGQPLRVTNDLALEDEHLWSADGGSLTFVSALATNRLEVQPLDGAAPREIVSLAGFEIEEVDISPDGRTVVYRSDRSGNLDLWSVPFEGGEPAILAASPVEEESPRFSPDGSTLAFHSHRAGTGDLWLMPSGGGEATQLTDWTSGEFFPRWSPDGSMIAFVSNRDADRNEVWVIPAAGGEARQLSTNHGNAVDLRWSPDGMTIYFIGVTPSGTLDLYSVAVSGGEPQPLGAHPGIGVGDLSPDGSQYAYATFDGGWGFIEVIPTAGGPPRRLTTRTERVFHNRVQWSGDGASLIVVEYDYPQDRYDLQVVTWPDGAWRQLTGTPRATEQPHVLTPDGRALLVVTSTHSMRIMSAPVAELLERNANR